MNEELLRSMIRESISRHLGTRSDDVGDPAPVTFAGHASHGRYTLPKSDGPCVIEPGVTCNQCGYCESHGH